MYGHENVCRFELKSPCPPVIRSVRRPSPARSTACGYRLIICNRTKDYEKEMDITDMTDPGVGNALRPERTGRHTRGHGQGKFVLRAADPSALRHCRRARAGRCHTCLPEVQQRRSGRRQSLRGMDRKLSFHGGRRHGVTLLLYGVGSCHGITISTRAWDAP